MSIRINCPACGKTLEVPETAVGKRAKCPACEHIWQVPAPAKPAPAVQPPQAAAIKTNCPGCGQTLQVPGTMLGKRIKCPACAHVWTISRPAVNAEPAPEWPTTPKTPAARATPGKPASPASPAKNEWFDEMMGDEYPIAAGQGFNSGLAGGSSVAAEPPRRPCPSCGEMIAVGAAKCRFCDAIFDETLRRSVKKKKRRSSSSDDDDPTALEWILCIFCSGIACIASIVYIIQGKPKGMKMFCVAFIMQVIIVIIRLILMSQHPEAFR